MSYNVYKITNTVNSKVYVGSTTCHIEVRWHKYVAAALNPNFNPSTPCQALYLDIREYGKENFIPEVLEECTTRKMMFGRERHWMKQLSSFRPNGYNIPPGNKKIKRNLSRYNPFGLFLDGLCTAKGWSFYTLAQEANTAGASIIQASTAQPGTYRARRATVLKWSQVLGCDKKTTDRLLHLAGHATEEEMAGREEAGSEKNLEN